MIRTSQLFETDPFLLTARLQPFWIACLLTTVVWGYWSTRLRTIRTPLFTGFLIYTAGTIGLATINPDNSLNALVFAALAGIGFGAPLILIVSGVQLSTPHHLIATATAVTTSSRAVAATVFTAVYSAAFSMRLDTKLPAYIATAATGAGLPATSLESFITALTTNDTATLNRIPGSNRSIIGAALAASEQAFPDSVRVAYLIAIPFGVVACIACCFLGDMKKTMNYRVDAPVEEMRAKHEPRVGVGAVASAV